VDAPLIRTLRVLYLFAGRKRKNDLASYLYKQAALNNLTLHLKEVDLLQNGEEDNVLDNKVWRQILETIERGNWDVIVGTPPCNDFSRAKFANSKGPRPNRSRQYPRGFPWLKGGSKTKADAANLLIDRTIEAFRLGHSSPASSKWLAEHPEDLGDTTNGGSPASIWQFPEMVDLIVQTDAVEGALHQCRYPGAASSKPTRLAGSVRKIGAMLHLGRPKFNRNMGYIGPLPRKCGHKRHKPILGWNEALGKFNTEPTSDYPPGMSEDIAIAIVNDFVERPPPQPNNGDTDPRTACGKGPSSSSPPRVSETPAPSTPSPRRVGFSDEVIFVGETKPTSAPSRTPADPEVPQPVLKKRRRQNIPHDVQFWAKVMATRTTNKASLEEEPHWHALVKDHDTSDEDEDKVARPKVGSGVVGQGPPLEVWATKRFRAFHDGTGLCSPGRWLPENRQDPCFLIKSIRESLLEIIATMDVRKIVATLACGKASECPFSASQIEQGRSAWAACFPAVIGEDMPLEPEPGQPFLCELIGETLRIAGDPDWKVWSWSQAEHTFSRGVGVGTRAPLPRIPAVYERKVSWKSYEDSLETSRPHSKENYPSIAPNLDAIKTQFLEEVDEGMLIEVYDNQVKDFIGDGALNVAALAAIRKTDDTFRVIHDGTHGVLVNPRIVVRDQMRCPGIPEQRTAMRQCQSIGSQVFALKGDIKKAHRRIKIQAADWGEQACRLEPDKLWLNKVGTFGVGSAAYWWSRAIGGIGRLTLMLMGKANFWQFIFADDLEWVVQGPGMFQNLVLAVFSQVVAGVPYSWKKFGGGLELEWIGYYLDYKRFEVGISEARAGWLIKWMRDTLASGGVLTTTMEEVLGRFGFAAIALPHLKPWLGPLYAWVAATPKGCFLALPVLVRLILTAILEALVNGGARIRVQVAREEKSRHFLADAMASDTRVGIGGWERLEGRPAAESPWFAEEFTPAEAPWIFAQGQDQAFRKIAALELIGTIACVRLFGNKERHLGESVVMSGLTDNKGNSHILAKLMTTSFPLCAVLLQLTTDLSSRGVELDLQWVPRDDNDLADALSNGRVDGMDPSLRRRFRLGDLKTFHKLLASGEECYRQIAERKAARKGPETRPHRKPEDRLRNASPWE